MASDRLSASNSATRIVIHACTGVNVWLYLREPSYPGFPHVAEQGKRSGYERYEIQLVSLLPEAPLQCNIAIAYCNAVKLVSKIVVTV